MKQLRGRNSWTRPCLSNKESHDSVALGAYHCCSKPWLTLGSATPSLSAKSSWVRHRLVAASSRSTDWKVPSRSGSGRHWRRASRARTLSLSLENEVLVFGYVVRQSQLIAYLKKHLTTCLRSLTVCCSTNWLTILLKTVPTA